MCIRDRLKFALTEKGFFTDTEQHKLIVCGDLFDRGKQAAELQEFIIDLLAKDEVILIRGNHEDLMLSLIHICRKVSTFKKDRNQSTCYNMKKENY